MGSRTNCPTKAAPTVLGCRATRRKSAVVSSIPTTTIVKKTRTGTPASTTGFSTGPPTSPGLPTLPRRQSKQAGLLPQHPVRPCFRAVRSCLAHTNPKRQRGSWPDPRSRFGLVYATPGRTALVSGIRTSSAFTGRDERAAHCARRACSLEEQANRDGGFPRRTQSPSGLGYRRSARRGKIRTGKVGRLDLIPFHPDPPFRCPAVRGARRKRRDGLPCISPAVSEPPWLPESVAPVLASAARELARHPRRRRPPQQRDFRRRQPVGRVQQLGDAPLQLPSRGSARCLSSAQQKQPRVSRSNLPL